MSSPGDKGAAPLGLADVERLDFAKGDGLLPAIVQHAATGAVLMLGYMNQQALSETLARGRVVFFSRSKQRLWEKGETSGHHLELAQIRASYALSHWIGTVYVENLSNAIGINSYSDPANYGPQNYQAIVSRPRTYGFTVGYSFKGW